MVSNIFSKKDSRVKIKNPEASLDKKALFSFQATTENFLELNV